MELLLNSAAVREKIRWLFSERTRKRRRVILVAYVGNAAPSLLPDARNVELYCWPQVGATDPYALAKLASPERGAKIHFVDGLHGKLYWVEGSGFIIGSANLSINALGQGRLQEFAVFIEDSAKLDIDRIITLLGSQTGRGAHLLPAG
jgi:phosphatidylserine/phosphatidylglycerophosphate/cardiolipin synthase-like enzyme